jgi:DNA mismatch repair protein MutS
VAAVVQALGEKPVTWLEESAFSAERGRHRLLEQFNTVSLEGFGCEGLKAGIAAAGALLFYIRQTQKQDVAHLRGLETYRLDSYLWLDEVSIRNLELFKNLQTGSRRGTLIGVVDRTVTAMGGRLLNHWLRYPLTEAARIQRRLAAVEEALAQIHTTAELREALKEVADLERLGSKIVMGQCNARDFIALKRSLQGLPALWTLLAGFESELLQWRRDLSELYALGRLIEDAIRDDAPLTVSEGNLIRPGFDDELDELIAISADGKGWLVKLESREKERTGITTLRVRFNKVFGYYIEVPKSRAADVPDHYVRKQTLVNSERYITDELKKFEMKVLGAEERRAALEYRIFSDIRQKAAAANGLIQDVARFLARLDCLLNLAFVAERRDYCRPQLNDEGCIHIEDGRHPVVETLIAGERFVPNSITLDDEQNQVLIITGPNMAGKSTVLRQVALSVVMAQMGSFVPAARASLAVTDRIFTRVGALDNLSSGQSTFLVEMQETANILNNATGRSLVIMDEIGRGTSTFDGLSIAWAVAAYLHDLHGRGVKTLFATHYHELTELARTKARVKNFNIAVKEWNEEIIFLRKLVAGGTNRSYGIQVARLAGIPGQVIRHARKVLAALENGDHHLAELSGKRADTAEPARGAVQLHLFERPEKTLLEKLRRADIARMTPLEALNWLNELQQQVRDL